MSDDEKVVEGDVVGGVPPVSGRPPTTFFHPLSGAVILAIDWLAFGLDFFSGFAAMAFASLAAFALTFYAVLTIQRQMRGDRPNQALLKALIAGVVAGVPFPVTGTIVGALIIAASGLPKLPPR